MHLQEVEQRLQMPRREFLQFCATRRPPWACRPAPKRRWPRRSRAAKRPSVIWLHFQECTGCSESLLRAEHPTLEKLILDVISLDYHETLMAAAGHQAEAARKERDEGQQGQVRAGGRRRDPDQGQRHLLQDRRPYRDRPAQGMRGRCRCRDRHRLLRLLGRHALDDSLDFRRRFQPDRLRGRGRRSSASR
jgi:Ni,Fe-hydrogenase I small subunit